MLHRECGYVTFFQVWVNVICCTSITIDGCMDFPVFVEVCGNCGMLITWDAEGRAVCKCSSTKLQFISEEDAIEQGILEGE